jgi:hypothetical protein
LDRVGIGHDVVVASAIPRSPGNDGHSDRRAQIGINCDDITRIIPSKAADSAAYDTDLIITEISDSLRKHRRYFKGVVR